MKAIQISQQGAPDVLRYVDVADLQPGAGEVLVRNRAIGVNFVDTYLRSGAFPADLPFVPGKEGAGEVLALGEGVSGFAVGDRVAYTETPGAYANAVRWGECLASRNGQGCLDMPLTTTPIRIRRRRRACPAARERMAV